MTYRYRALRMYPLRSITWTRSVEHLLQATSRVKVLARRSSVTLVLTQECPISRQSRNFSSTADTSFFLVACSLFFSTISLLSLGIERARDGIRGELPSLAPLSVNYFFGFDTCFVVLPGSKVCTDAFRCLPSHRGDHREHTSSEPGSECHELRHPEYWNGAYPTVDSSAGCRGSLRCCDIPPVLPASDQQKLSEPDDGLDASWLDSLGTESHTAIPSDAQSAKGFAQELAVQNQCLCVGLFATGSGPFPGQRLRRKPRNLG